MLRLEGPLNWGINSQSQNVMISDSWWKQWQCRSERERTSTVWVGFIGSHPFHSRLLQVVPEARIATAARLQRPGFHGRNPWCQARSEGLGMFRVPVGSRFRAMVEKHFLKRLWSGILTKWEIFFCVWNQSWRLGSVGWCGAPNNFFNDETHYDAVDFGVPYWQNLTNPIWVGSDFCCGFLKWVCSEMRV